MNGRIRWTESISTFAVGFGVGAAIGILFAPRSGDDTREHILESAKDGVDGAVAAGQKLIHRAQQGVDEAKGRVRHAKKVGEDAFREAKNSSS
ncbi:MAG TPA: YtxH domain-containing protein [Candidatus Sulfotelmatobacter sp.]|jgi:gas vesicle protein